MQRCKRILLILLTLLVWTASWSSDDPTAHERSFRVLTYHSIHADGEPPLDRYSVSVATLVQHLSWLRMNGYQPISVDDVLAAREGKRPLPDKAVMLTFDDGLRNFRTHAFPLLRAFGFPAVLSVVGSWLELSPGSRIEYGRVSLLREDFLSWQDIREMLASGLVEIASHSFDLHQGIRANPQGNELPAAVARSFNPQGGYESERSYLERVRSDLIRSSNLIRQRTGFAPRIMVWPYGRYSQATIDLARQAGMAITMNLDLDEVRNRPTGDLSRVQRFLVEYDHDVQRVAEMMVQTPKRQPVRVIHVDLDYVFDEDPAQQEANLSRLLDRVKDMRISTVYLQAFADPDGDGVADALYFPNRRMPMRADLFSRVAWQLHTRSSVEVFAWMPLLAFDLPVGDPARGELVLAEGGVSSGYRRLSPFSMPARDAISEIYEDLGRHAIFQGILFHDDATLSDYEDVHPEALQYYSSHWGFSSTLEQLRTQPDQLAQWTAHKIGHLTAFSLDLARKAQYHQPRLKTARNLYARVVLEPESEVWFAQSLANALQHYDQIAIMAMPYMEGADEPIDWLDRLVDEVAKQPEGLRKAVFELQTVDWRTDNAKIDSRIIAKKMHRLQTRGALSFGYYPDDFHRNHPDLETIRPVFSLGEFPFRDQRSTALSARTP